MMSVVMYIDVLTAIHEHVLAGDVLAHTVVWESVPATSPGGLYAAMHTYHRGTQLMNTKSSPCWVWPSVSTSIWSWIGACLLKFYSSFFCAIGFKYL